MAEFEVVVADISELVAEDASDVVVLLSCLRARSEAVDEELGVTMPDVGGESDWAAAVELVATCGS